MKTTVVMLKARRDIKADIHRLLVAIYGDSKPWTRAKKVLIKINAVNFEPHVFVEPRLVGALVAVLREDGVEVDVMEGCTNGSFTRLVFRVTGLDKAVRSAGGRCLYLDEGRAEVVDAGAAGTLSISAALNDMLLINRDDYFYINLAKLKTHSMTTVTLCLKNQWGFIDPKNRGHLHNDFLHESIKQVYRLFKPDLCLVEALVATNHGHFPLVGFENETLWHGGVLMGGTDPVSVDAAACRLIGIDPHKVKHIAVSAENPTLLAPEEVRLDPINPPPAPFTDELHPFFPEDVVVHKGVQRCCKEGCYSNPVCAVQVLAANYGGHGGFALFLGKGHDPETVADCKTPALVVGDCAIKEVYLKLVKRLGRKNVKLSPGHNNLKKTIRGLMPLMGVTIRSAAPLPLCYLAWAYVRHKLAGSRADIGFF